MLLRSEFHHVGISVGVGGCLGELGELGCGVLALESGATRLGGREVRGTP